MASSAITRMRGSLNSKRIDPTTSQRLYHPDEVEFMCAVDNYKRKSGRMFPTYSELLMILRSLGYKKDVS